MVEQDEYLHYLSCYIHLNPIGSDGFFTHIKEKFIDPNRQEPEVPVLRAVNARIEPSMEKVRSIVEKYVINDKRLRRSISIYLSRKYTQKTLNEIADFYGGINYTGVSQAWKRIETRRGNNKGVADLLLTIEEEITKCEV